MLPSQSLPVEVLVQLSFALRVPPGAWQPRNTSVVLAESVVSSQLQVVPPVQSLGPQQSTASTHSHCPPPQPPPPVPAAQMLLMQSESCSQKSCGCPVPNCPHCGTGVPPTPAESPQVSPPEQSLVLVQQAFPQPLSPHLVDASVAERQ